jgi:ADP-heptose:LPS heptosyltransferase
MSTAGWASARDILCVRLDALGDVLMCTPALRALRQARPGRRLTLLGSHSGAAAPFIDELDGGQLGAAIRLASVTVSNNTGPAHMAAAIGTPLVDLYALTNPQHTPWQVEHRLLFHDVACRNCYKSVCPQGHHDCLVKIDPARVADAVCSLLASTAQQLRHAC